jgi:Tfp pilus assembly protein PilF
MKKILALAAAACVLLAEAAPRVPAGDADILERLPGRPRDPASVELRELRQALAQDPQDPQRAARLARALFRMAIASGDPRYVGYAEAALAPWRWQEAPAEVLFARGLLRQYRHDFRGALADLQRTLELDPAHEGARAWRAAIFMVRAEYDAAARECAALPRDALYSIACSAYVQATTGGTKAAYARLLKASAEKEADPQDRLWVQTRLAEMAWRLGEPAAAERHFREALALGIEDNFLLAAYADFLLESGRPGDAIALLRERTRSDTLLLRFALAQKAAGAADAESSIRALGERFAAASLRGEKLHLAEEARYLLDLKGDAKGALAAASENWNDQREPRDALVLLQAAAAAGDAKAAEPVLRWLRESRFESPRLQRLASALK